LNVVLVGALMASHQSDQVEECKWNGRSCNGRCGLGMWIGCTKDQGGSAKSMDAPTFMRLNGYFVSIWTTNTGFTCR